ncbi:thioredoxin family protein [Flammeovirga sp. EKP202]|uniref:thioredoxin family protein n=1 Tax=Flammeovirga sp. EKP202 TaxID=2770592 RepID=UPI00165FF05B|nr:thioredoxin family protein [Flammeovirga sp. EKP202]MBD0403950.1 thioredoxin family protein [Flammeovirga sp. EKP202]
MKKITLTFLFSLLTSFLFAQDQGIEFFEGSWKDAKIEAKKTNKYIFVDAYTTWCGPCKYLKKNVFTDKNVGEFYNAQYISVAIDMEKGEGIEFAKKVEVKAFPTLLYFNPEGELVHKMVGAAEPKDFIRYGADALDPSKQFYTLERKVKSTPNPSKEELRSYLQLAYAAASSEKTLLDKWLAMLKEEDFNDKENLKLIAHATSVAEVSDEVVKVFRKNEEKIMSQFDNFTAKDMYQEIASNTLYDIQETASLSEWNSEKNRLVKALGNENVEEVFPSLDAVFYISKKDWQNASLSIDKVIMIYEQANDPYLSQRLNTYAWEFFKSKVGEKYLKKALTWANRSVELKEGYANLDTQAHLFYKLKKYDQAKFSAEKSIEYAKGNGQNYTSTQQLLDRINAML